MLLWTCDKIYEFNFVFPLDGNMCSVNIPNKIAGSFGNYKATSKTPIQTFILYTLTFRHNIAKNRLVIRWYLIKYENISAKFHCIHCTQNIWKMLCFIRISIHLFVRKSSRTFSRNRWNKNVIVMGMGAFSWCFNINVLFVASKRGVYYTVSVL